MNSRLGFRPSNFLRLSAFGLRISVLAAAFLLFAAFLALAYPPTLYHSIYGLVRDELGDPLATTNAQVILTPSGSTNVITATVVPYLGPAMNYKLKVPMDAGVTVDNYQANALRTQAPFTLTVKMGTTTYLPIQMQGSLVKLGSPGQQTHLDLTMGQDSIGDGIPDAWKWMVVEMSNGLYTDISQIHPGDRFPGYPMTMLQAYIAGTYVWDPTDVFSLLVVGMDGKAPVVQFNAIQGRTYSLVMTTDLRQWTPVQIRQAYAPSASLMSSYIATQSSRVQFEVPPSSGSPTNQFCFFRAIVQ
jgi:hypothetical protein